MKLHILRCGTMRVSETVPEGGEISLALSARQLLAPDSARVTLPNFCYLLEHPKGLFLIDTGWCREISPSGEYDAKAVRSVLPAPLAALYHPRVETGMTALEQLADMGIRPEDLAGILLTHLDADNVAGLRSLRGAQRIVLPEDEYFWACRTVYKARQPWSLWEDLPIERIYYRGSPLGPNRWAFDLLGDGSITMVNVPGHTDGMAAVILQSGKSFAVLASDAAFTPRNWREKLAPGYGFDRKKILQGLDWLAGLEKDPACAAILCSHDPAVTAKMIEF